MKTVFLAAFAMLLTAFADAPLPDPTQEAEAQALMKELRCLVCQSQSIAESDAEMAADMRALVRERISEGEDPQEIRNYLIRRYGDWVTFSPPARGPHLILWLAPVVLIVGGGLIAARLFRRRGRA